MDRQRSGAGPEAEYHLSSVSARRVADSAGPPPGNRRFLSTDHLSAEAVAAYVDHRLPAAGLTRADAHLARCPRCRQEVSDQRDARRALRGSGPIHMPEDLRDRLRSLGEGGPPGSVPGDAPDAASGPGAAARPPAPHGLVAGLLRRLRNRGR